MTRVKVLVVCCLATAMSAFAADPQLDNVSRSGRSMMSFSLSTTTVTAGNDTLTTIAANASYGSFLSEHTVLNLGISAGGTVGGSGTNSTELKNLVNADVGLIYYFSGKARGSFYLGLDYYFQLLQNQGEGFAFARLGYQSFVNEHVAFFGEVGYGRAIKNFGGDGTISSLFGFRYLF